MAVTCGCERNSFGTIEKLCADHSFAEQRRCHGLIRRAEELEAALRPFAALADQVAREAITSPTDATIGLLSVAYADLRRASEALNK